MYQGEGRWILMSRMYYWAQAFKERYPNDMKVYYESEDFVCYVMPQNMYHQYNFAIDYGYNQFRTQEDKNLYNGFLKKFFQYYNHDVCSFVFVSVFYGYQRQTEHI